MEIVKNAIRIIQRDRVSRHLLFWFVIIIINIPSGLLGDDPIY